MRIFIAHYAVFFQKKNQFKIHLNKCCAASEGKCWFGILFSIHFFLPGLLFPIVNNVYIINPIIQKTFPSKTLDLIRPNKERLLHSLEKNN